MADPGTTARGRGDCLLDAFEEAPLQQIGEAVRTHARARLLAARMHLEPREAQSELHRELWPVLQYRRTTWDSLCYLATAVASTNPYLAYECLDRARDRMPLEAGEVTLDGRVVHPTRQTLASYFRCLAACPGLHEKYPRLAARGLEALRRAGPARAFHLVGSTRALTALGMDHAVERRALDEVADAAAAGDPWRGYLGAAAYLACASEREQADLYRWDTVISNLLRCERPYLHAGCWRLLRAAAGRLGARTARRVTAVLTREDEEAGISPALLTALVSASSRGVPDPAEPLRTALEICSQLRDPDALVTATRLLVETLADLPPRPSLAPELNRLHARAHRLLRRHEVDEAIREPLLARLARELVRGTPARAAQAMAARLMHMVMGSPPFAALHGVVRSLPEVLEGLAADGEDEAASTVGMALLHFLPEIHELHWKAADAPDRDLFRCWVAATRVLLPAEHRFGQELFMRGLLAIEAGPAEEALDALGSFAPLLGLLEEEDLGAFLPRMVKLAITRAGARRHLDGPLRDFVDATFDAVVPEGRLSPSPLCPEDLRLLDPHGPLPPEPATDDPDRPGENPDGPGAPSW